MNRRLFRIGELAHHASVTGRTLRYYDRVGLLAPSQYSESGYRLYTEQDLLTIRRIRALKALGFSLEQILACLNSDPAQLAVALHRQKQSLLAQRTRLDAALQAVEQIEAQLQESAWDWEFVTHVIEENQNMTTATTLAQALKGLEDQFVKDNRPHFIPLVDIDSVREAIRVAQVAYDHLGAGAGEGYYRSVIQPLLRGIAGQGDWPANAGFSAWYEHTDEQGVTYQGLGVDIEIWSPGDTYKGYSLPILDLWYGRWT